MMPNDIPHLDLECSNASIRLVGQTRNRPAETGKKKKQKKGFACEKASSLPHNSGSDSTTPRNRVKFIFLRFDSFFLLF